jgi:four helix bundle protein
VLGSVKAKPTLRVGRFASLDSACARRASVKSELDRTMEVLMLRICSFILDVLRKVAAVEGRIRKHDPDLARQLRRAASSIALNCAEASGSQGGNVRARFRNALGSTYETRACLDVAEVFGYAEVDAQLRDDLDRIGATLYRLIS